MLEQNIDYQQIAKAIAFMEKNYLAKPSLSAIAQHLNLSEYHFQKVFSKWVGISPKRYLQNLTLEDAKAKMFTTGNLLDLTLEVGLSSPGRLHDLFITLEAITPGEYKNLGAGLEIVYGIHDTPFGKALIATTVRGICNLHFVNDPSQALGLLHQEWPQANIIFSQQDTQEVIKRIFSGNVNNQPVALWVKGTNFQIQVWRALLKIPFGCVSTYEEIGEVIAQPKAARAVGNAVGNNPVALLIPCHRVVRKSGELGGYRWGLSRKASILASETKKS